ncbi:pyruvate kinase [Patescibacteria group bacterium]
MPNIKKTKIIATIGPSSENKNIMLELLDAGVNIFRFNMKHNTSSWHEEKINQARHISKEKGVPLGILIDLQGPEIRIKTVNDKVLKLSENEEFLCTYNEKYLAEGGKIIIIPEPLVIKNIDVNDNFTIDDGKNHFIVTKKGEDFVIVKSLGDYEIGTNKSLNLIQKDLPLASLTDSDIKKLNIAAKIKPEFIALSFVRSQEDIKELRKEMGKRHLNSEIISKIESQKGVDNIDEIINESDGIMIARGDLGIETPIERVPYFQKETIQKCRHKLKSVIVATQMLESMMYSSIPSRSEAADISNAVFDSTDCTMLSGETAQGKYPVLSASVMSKIVKYNEDLVEHKDIDIECLDITKRVAHAVLSVSKLGKIDKIVALTASGYTADIISALRPMVPIIAVTDKEDTFGKLTINYGTVPVLSKIPVGDIFSYDKVINQLKKESLISAGDKIVVTHGQKFGVPGKTNSLVFLEI